MEESGSSMRSSNPQLGEMTIKVPAPFAGVSDLGFTARYRAQHFNEPQRDVPLLFEGPQPPMRRLAEMLQLLSASESAAYMWTDPVMLSDEVVILAFRDRSVAGQTLSDGARIADYVLVARRNGRDWYVGAMTDWTPRDLEVDMSFLPEGSFTIDAYQDGLNADHNASDYRKTTNQVSKSTKLKIHLAPGGGWAARIHP